MRGTQGDFALTPDELRAVARFVLESARVVLPTFEAQHPGDVRPRWAIEAAEEFAAGAPRTKLQRIASMEAHRAARGAATEEARLAARAAGDAASAAYLHPIARADQVGHILRATALRARIAELQAGGDPAAGARVLEEAAQRATPALVGVLCRYPAVPPGHGRVAQLQADLDAALRPH